MRTALAKCAGVLVFLSVAAGGADIDRSAPPVVEQILSHAAALGLSPEQIQALEVIRDRRARTLDALAERLRVADSQTTVAAEQDAVAVMQEIGRLRVMSGQAALQQLTPAQRQRWVALQQEAANPSRTDP